MQIWKKRLAVFLSLMMLISVIPLQVYSLENISGEDMLESSEAPIEDYDDSETVGGSENLDNQEDPSSQEEPSDEEASEDPEVPVDQEIPDSQEGLDEEEPSMDTEEPDPSIISDKTDASDNSEQLDEQESLKKISDWANLLNDENIEEYQMQKELLLHQGIAFADLYDDDMESSDSYYKMIANDYIEVSVNGRGEFTVGTREGNPDSDTDDYQNLLYGHPYPGTSETLIRIDGTDYIFSYNTTSVIVDGNECIATANIDGVEVKQILSLQTNPYTNIQDVVSIRYQYKNNSNSTKQVGVRIMLDTMLGDNDGSPFRVNGLDVTRETEYTGDSIPQYWQSFYSLSDPRVVSTGFFYYDVTEKPDKVQFASWPGIVGSSWNYQISTDMPVTYDSAVAAYFNPRTVVSGGSGSVVTYYGVSGFSNENSDLREPLAVRVTAPSKLFGDVEMGGYLNNPFNLSVYMNNISGRTLGDVSVELDLSKTSDKLILASDQKDTVTVGDMYIDESQTVQWNLQAVPQFDTSTVPYTILFYSGETLLKSMNMELSLDALDEDNMYCTITFDLNGTEGIPPEAQRVPYGETIDKPDDPISEDVDYEFDGWYKNSSCTIPWDFEQDRAMVNTRLYAKWVEIDLGFKVTGIEDVDDNEIYIVDGSDDAYYEMGVRTVLVSDSNVDLSGVKLKYEVDRHVNVVVDGVQQTSGVTEVDFLSGQAIEYSVVSPSGKSSRNYLVTVMKRQDEANLFVNAYNEFQSRVLLLPSADSYHNIFLANTGSMPLDDLTVRLEADNLAVEEASLVRASSITEVDYGTLPGFSDTDGTASDQNYTIIRLYPSGRGEIKGTLTISAGGQEVAIELTGVAGDPFRDTALSAVKYVPFEADLKDLLDYFDLYDKVEFSPVVMPSWLALKDGVLSGVPLSTGVSTVILNVTLGIDDQETTIQTTITLTVNDNSDRNVEAEIDPDYAILQRVPDMVTVRGNQNFTSKGPFDEFIALYLDGRRLQEWVEYEAHEGSTAITVYEQTFQPLSTGTHTLAATFQSESGVKSVAQNFYIGQRDTGSSSGGGDSSTSYRITVPNIANCTVSVSPTSASANSRVTLTVKPDAGYKLTNLTVTGPKSEQISLTQASEYQYTFRMPSGNVVISAQVEAEQPAPVPAGDTPFVDMLETDWFYESVVAAYENGWMVGTSANTFAPYAITSRGMFVSVLHRIAGEPSAENNAYFSDVSLDQYYASAAAWAAEQGIISGYGDGRFGSSDDLTREQIVMILYNYANLTGMDTTARSELTQFTDLDKLSSGTQTAMSWANSVGLISGKGDGILDPTGSASRAEMAALLVRFAALAEKQ